VILRRARRFATGSLRMSGILCLGLCLCLCLCGCASLVDVNDVLKRMEKREVDTVLTKLLDRYPQAGRMIASEPFVFVLDSVVVGRRLEGAAERELIRTFASYMLGEQAGRGFVGRVEDERAIYGEGVVILTIYRGPAGERYVLDVVGSLTLYLPLAKAGGRAEGVEALSFDVRAANQVIEIDEKGAAPEIYLEVVPRNAVYTQQDPVFKRYEGVLFHLGWRGQGEATPKPGASVGGFLRASRAYVAPVVKLAPLFRPRGDGTLELAHGVANPVALVLPTALLAGNRELEGVVARLAQVYPGHFENRGEDLVIRVGYFFFHSDATGPGPPDPTLAERVPPFKAIRLPPAGPAGGK